MTGPVSSLAAGDGILQRQTNTATASKWDSAYAQAKWRHIREHLNLWIKEFSEGNWNIRHGCRGKGHFVRAVN